MFDLTRPCTNCPFRKGQGSTFGLHPQRLDEIFKATAFQCHKTVDYRKSKPKPGDRPQQCAGLMAVLYRSGRDNQIMQVAERLAGFDGGQLDPQREAYDNIEQALAAHAGREP